MQVTVNLALYLHYSFKYGAIVTSCLVKMPNYKGFKFQYSIIMNKQNGPKRLSKNKTNFMQSKFAQILYMFNV